MEKKIDNHTLTIIDVIEAVIIRELNELIYPEGKTNMDIFKQKSPYIKFLPVVACIEFLGACYDEHPFDSTRVDVNDIVEKRFNKAIKELFHKRYHQYSKAGSNFYLYKKLRCPMIHQLKPGPGIFFTTRMESLEEGTVHLQEYEQGKLILVLEDLYDDLKKAGEKINRLFKNGNLTNKKGNKAFIDVINIRKTDVNNGSTSKGNST